MRSPTIPHLWPDTGRKGFDPEFLRDYNARSIKVAMKENDSQSSPLTLITPSAN